NREVIPIEIDGGKLPKRNDGDSLDAARPENAAEASGRYGRIIIPKGGGPVTELGQALLHSLEAPVDEYELAPGIFRRVSEEQGDGRGSRQFAGLPDMPHQG